VFDSQVGSRTAVDHHRLTRPWCSIRRSEAERQSTITA